MVAHGRWHTGSRSRIPAVITSGLLILRRLADHSCAHQLAWWQNRASIADSVSPGRTVALQWCIEAALPILIPVVLFAADRYVTVVKGKGIAR